MARQNCPPQQDRGGTSVQPAVRSQDFYLECALLEVDLIGPPNFQLASAEGLIFTRNRGQTWES